MRVFMTGATGFIGAYLIPELIGAGNQVVGLHRSEDGAAKLAGLGAEPFLGDVNDPERLRAGVETADGVIHAAFNHDFSRVKQHSEEDRKVIATLGDALGHTGRPLVVTSGTGLVERREGRGAVAETDPHASLDSAPRAATEEAADTVSANGGHVVVVRLPQVHDTRHQGRIGLHIRIAREKGRVAYVGDGANRLPAVHVSDAARLFRLALEQGEAGARYHAVAEEGVPMRDIAEVLASGLDLPLASITPEEAPGYFGVLAGLAAVDLAATSTLTRQALGWRPTGPDLLTDLRAMEWVDQSPSA